MRRSLLLALVLVLAFAAPALAARGGKHAALTAGASIEATVAGDYVTYTWTGADGGWLHIEDSCRHSWVSSGVGDGSFYEWASCPGDALVTLISANGSVLATDTFTV